AIPPTNPFVGQAGFAPEIWDLGLRNPWRFAIDRSTGDVYIGDVGQSDREEIDFDPAPGGGHNYGGRGMEGTLCQGPAACPVPACGDPLYEPPVYEYDHSNGQCAVMGGVVYRGCAIPDLQGTYFFADYCANKIWSFRLVGGQVTEFTDRTLEL